jgi:pentatricopeptide repeat protein
MHCYGSMLTVYMIPATLEHYTCMVDLLGRAGHLQEADNMIKEMFSKPNVAACGPKSALLICWTSLVTEVNFLL